MELAEQITMPMRQFEAAANLSHQRVYDLINAGDIESVLIGERRYVIVKSYYDYLDRLKQQQASTPLRQHPNTTARTRRRAAA